MEESNFEDRGKIFTYAILHHPEPAKEGDPVPASELVIPPTELVAKNGNEALIRVAREIPEKYVDHLDEIEVLIRPF